MAIPKFLMSNKPKLIGLSFSLCITDILSGKIPLKKVSKLITGTKCRTESDFLDLIQEYKQLNYWENHSVEEVVEIYQKIKHLIQQPRLENKGCPIHQGGKRWVTDEKEIKWIGRKNEK